MTTTENTTRTCRRPTCSRPHHGRGLCKPCYNLIRGHAETWTLDEALAWFAERDKPPVAPEGTVEFLNALREDPALLQALFTMTGEATLQRQLAWH